MQENSSEEFLKIDRRGHVRVSRERRETLLDEFERCGVSAAQFATHVGVKYHTFAHWRQRRERARRPGNQPVVASLPTPVQSGVRWVEAIVESHNSDAGASTASPGLNLVLPGGARLEIANVAQAALAAELLRALENKGRIEC